MNANKWVLEKEWSTIDDSKIKRIFDFFLSLVGIFAFTFLFPFFLVIPVAIIIEDGFPIFFSLDKVGKNGKLFRMYKFRSMVKDAERNGVVWVDKNPSKLTKVGRFLRATAMDELPQLFSILKGDMSFVGPRPYRVSFEEQFSKEIENYSLRHLVRPGLTGLAQVYGKKYMSPRQRLRFDLLYIKKRSFCMDLKLILISGWNTLRRRWESRDRKIKRVKIGKWRII